MSGYPGPEFMLRGRSARRLYHDYAEGLPIVDYHSHLPPAAMAENPAFPDLHAAWLAGDHYKWRALRAAGVSEERITGGASPRAKFQAWAETVPRLPGNPLYHWTRMELAFPFRLRSTRLDGRTAARVWDACNERLREPAFRPRGLLKQFRVRVAVTTDDPCDEVSVHVRATRAAARDSTGVRVLPGFRPDRALALEQPAAWVAWIDRLAQAAGVAVRSPDDLLDALDRRAAVFHGAGCRIADHGLSAPPRAEPSLERARAAFRAARAVRVPPPADREACRAWLLDGLGRIYARRGWTMQLHCGPLRSASTRLARTLGPDVGGDAIGDEPMMAGLAAMLDRLDRDDALPKTILYNINPRDNEAFAALAGVFQRGPVVGKVQYGSAWWFLDNEDGIRRQLTALSTQGLLSGFVGMLTDSRSFLSFSRHDYFRRILCDHLGRQIDDGRLPAEFPLFGRMVKDICYDNAVRYFGFGDKI